MPIDSERKRRSTIPGTLPSPDGTIDEGDRRTSLDVYEGDTSPAVDTGQAILILRNIRNRVDVKITRDRGTDTSSASAAVTVSFNKTFADIIAIDVFPVQNAGTKIYRVIDFVDAPNPVSFNVRLYNDAGTQLAIPFGWEASGILKSS